MALHLYIIMKKGCSYSRVPTSRQVEKPHQRRDVNMVAYQEKYTILRQFKGIHMHK